MRKFRNVIKGGICYGLAAALMLSGTACGKEEIKIDDYIVETDTGSEGDTNSTESGSENNQAVGGSLREMFGENISVNETFTIGGVTAIFKLKYEVPDEEHINVYEGKFIDNSSDIENQIVSNFFGGTEKKLEEIKYVNDSDYIPLMYKYNDAILFLLSSNVDAAAAADLECFPGNIDSSFDKVYTWVDGDTFYIHMYEGEYKGNKYGMIYYYDKAMAIRNIYICPISVTEYFTDFDAKTMFVVDQQTDFGSDNLCKMSESDITNETNELLELLGMNKNDIILSYNPAMAVPGTKVFGSLGLTDYSKMPQIAFSDGDDMNSVIKINSTNPGGRTFAYEVLREQQPSQPGQSGSDDVNFIENGYAVYLCAEAYLNNANPDYGNIFNRGNIYYTDKGLYEADLSVAAEIDNVVNDVQLLSFDNIKESLKDAIGNDQDITQKSSGSLDITKVEFTYNLIHDDEDANKASYVPAWYFEVEDNKLKSGEDRIKYWYIINAIDGTLLEESSMQ